MSLTAVQGATRSAPLTPANGADLAEITRGLYVTVAGIVRVHLADDDGSTAGRDIPVAAGVCHPLQVKKLFQTGTTATGIIAVY